MRSLIDEEETPNISDNKNLFVEQLKGGCSKSFCAREVFLENGSFVEMKKAKTSLSKKELLDFMNGFETVDSIDEIQVMDAAKMIADSTFALCNGNQKCTVQITFFNQQLKLVDIRLKKDTLQITSINNSISDADSLAKDIFAIADTSVYDSVAEKSSIKSDDNAINNDSLEFENVIPSKFKREKILYTGVGVIFGFFDERGDEFKNGRIDGLEGGLEYFLRWHFYSAGSFQMGLGFNYHYVESLELEKRNLTYHNISVEIPLQLRLGVPIHKNFKPFISIEEDFRKPICSIADVFDRDWNFDTYHEDDFEFVTRFGIGSEILENFSFEFQFMIAAAHTGYAHHYDLTNPGYFRTKFEYHW